MIAPQDLSDEFASNAVNLVNCGVIVLDSNQNIVLWNRWMVARSGRAAGRVLLHSLLEIFPELAGSRVHAAVQSALQDNATTNVPQSQSRCPFPLREAGSFDGERIDQAVSVTPFKEGKASYCMIEIRDVSDRVVRERQMLEHAESLRARSHIDGLTGIYNRRYFDLALDRELRRAQRGKSDLSLLLMDIDSFKAYNDHFGHPEGDACLIKVAQALGSMLKRPADVAARYGGEEFAAVLPDTSSEKAHLVANTIREHVSALALTHAPTAVRPYVTISIGVASYSAGRLSDAASLIEAADRALYGAKRGGRDRVMLETELDLE